MKERQNTKDNHIFRSIDTARKRNEYPIFNKEYPTDEIKAKEFVQEHRYWREKAGVIPIFFTLDIGYSLLDIGYSNYLTAKNGYSYLS